MRTSSQVDLQVSIYWAKYWCGNIYSLPVIGVFSLRVSHFERKTLMSRSEKMWSHQCFVNQWIRVQVQARSTSCLCVWWMGLTRLWAKYLVRQDALVDIWRFKIGLTRLWAMSPVRHDALMDLWILIKFLFLISSETLTRVWELWGVLLSTYVAHIFHALI